MQRMKRKHARTRIAYLAVLAFIFLALWAPVQWSIPEHPPSPRRTAIWIENQILHPEVMTKEDPISHELFAKFSLQMPNQKLTDDEARAVIEFFKHKDKEAAAAVH